MKSESVSFIIKMQKKTLKPLGKPFFFYTNDLIKNTFNTIYIITRTGIIQDTSTIFPPKHRFQNM